MVEHTVCVRPPANIGPNGRRYRFVMGIVGVLVACAIAIPLRDPGVERVWRLAVGVPLLIGVMGLLQAKENT